jgi:phosphate transport system protein
MAAEDRYTRVEFDQTLRRLEDDLLRMGVFAGALLTRSVEALKRYDGAAAAAVVADDDEADRMHIEIEQRVMGLLATQQPVASDLRTLAAILAVSIDLERMADHAEGIGDAIVRLTQRKMLVPPANLMYMEQIVRGMLYDVLEAFVRRDTVLAEAVAVKDETVDALRAQVFRGLLTYMAESPRMISPALDLMLVAQHLERAADHVTNVAERVIYMVTGEMRELNAHAVEVQR